MEPSMWMVSVLIWKIRTGQFHKFCNGPSGRIDPRSPFSGLVDRYHFPGKKFSFPVCIDLNDGSNAIGALRLNRLYVAKLPRL